MWWASRAACPAGDWTGVDLVFTPKLLLIVGSDSKVLTVLTTVRTPSAVEKYQAAKTFHSAVSKTLPAADTGPRNSERDEKLLKYLNKALTSYPVEKGKRNRAVFWCTCW